MENLKKLRQKFNITQDDLAKILNVSKMLIYQYEKDLRQPGLDRLVCLSDLFHCTIDYLLDRTAEIKVPVIPKAWWHLTYYAADIGKVTDYITLELPADVNTEYFCLRPEDETMAPIFHPRDLLVLQSCSSTEQPANKNIYLVAVGQECLLTFIERTEDGVILFPKETVNFTPRHYSNNVCHALSFHILGEVIKVIRNELN